MERETRHVRSAVVAAALVVSAVAPALAQQQPDAPIFRILAQNGDTVAGRANRTVAPVICREALGLDRSGRALFDGTLNDGAGAFVAKDVVFVADGNTVRAVFAPGDVIAGGIDTNGGAIQFVDIDRTRYSPTGEVLAAVEITGGAAPGPALLTDVSGTQRVAVIRVLPFPGVCGIFAIGNGLSTGQYGLNNGHLVFHAGLASCGNDLRVVYRSSGGGAATLIAAEEGPVPGRPGQTFDQVFSGPALNEQGAYLFTGRYVDDADTFGVLLLSEPAAALQLVTATGSVVPGTSEIVTGFHTWRIGPDVDATSGPRRLYVVNASTDPDDNGVPVHHFVFDSAHGTNPIIGTGTAAGGFTFTAQALSFTRSIDVAIANGDTAVIVGDTTGNGIPAGGEAVWRYDTRSQPSLGVVLHEGGPIPGDDPRAAGRTISRLLTVNLNEEGRLAVECEITGGQAILIEEKGAANAGKFRIAVLLRDDIPIRGGGTAEVFGLLNQFPSFPPVTGTGEDSLQTRFNRNGQFVFRARLDPNDGSPSFTAVCTVSLDPPPETCDVTVKQKGRNLSIKGGKGDCEITVRSDAAGDITVVPGTDTTVNGESAAFAATGVDGSVKIAMGGGNDRVILESTNASCDQSSAIDVRKNLTIDTGAGVDTLRITNFEILGSLTIKTGNSGSEAVTVGQTCIGRKLKLLGGAVEADVDFSGTVVEGKTTIKMAGAAAPALGQYEFDNCDFFHTKVKGSRFSDDLSFDECRVGGNLSVDTGPGALASVRLSDVTLEPGALRIGAKKSGFLTARLTDIDGVDGGFRLDTGKNGCDVMLLRCSFVRDVNVRTGGSGDAQQSKLDVQNVFFDDAFVVRGKGNHDIAMGTGSKVARGIAINLKGGVLDLVSVSSTEIEKGHLQVSSKAGAFEGRFHTNQLLDGDIRVRGTQGADEVYVSGSNVNGTVQVSCGKGNDLVDIQGVTVSKDLRLFGGAGTDLLDNGLTTSNGVTGDTVEDSFEGVPPPP